MDSQKKSGKAYLQPHKAGKKWKPVWLSLFPSSSSGVGRLEIMDLGGSAAGDQMTGVRRHYQTHVERKLKVVQLSELLSVLRLPPNAEACPMENMSAFCVETTDRTMVFAVLKDDCVEWVEKLYQSTFQRGVGFDQLQMEENQIYASTDEVSEFWVVVHRTDAAARCGLKGSFWLQVGQEALLLKDTQMKNTVQEWPYILLRRYGSDKLAITIEAGRRCESGPGTFTFETQQAEKIFTLIQSTIKRKTSTLGNPNQEAEEVIGTNIRAHSPLPKIPDVTNMSALLENTLRTLDRKSAALEESTNALEVVAESQQPAPITLMPLPRVPTYDGRSGGRPQAQPEAVYADPADCIQPVPKRHPTTSLYVDPACILPLKPPSSGGPVTDPPTSSAPHPSFTIRHPDSVYSEVYDKISPVQDKQTVIQSKGKMKPFANDEPIYTEPVSKTEEVSQKNENKPNPFAHLYAQVHKTPPSSSVSSPSSTVPSCSASSSSSQTSSVRTTKAIDDPLDDVIYENLGII